MVNLLLICIFYTFPIIEDAHCKSRLTTGSIYCLLHIYRRPHTEEPTRLEGQHPRRNCQYTRWYAGEGHSKHQKSVETKIKLLWFMKLVLLAFRKRKLCCRIYIDTTEASCLCPTWRLTALPSSIKSMLKTYCLKTRRMSWSIWN